ncbi:MAG: winged helix-turn-helix transcriptional regulator [Vampirovibrio sp.]|jgi:DNA-binding transcriptional ArsR family regulator|nr:winged helix-turn-helix transcriptional regulator [Vampirovibrio sp.]
MPVKTEKIAQASRCLKALAHPTRLSILCLLKEGEHNVQQIETAIGTTQSNISTHLGVLRDKEILITRKEANQVFYRVRDPRMFELLVILQEIYCKD